MPFFAQVSCLQNDGKEISKKFFMSLSNYSNLYLLDTYTFFQITTS